MRRHTRYRLQLLAVFVMAISVLMPGSPTLAQQDDRVASVTSAAIEVSRLERGGEWLLLHDRLQPDVRLVVSRGELFSWYSSPQAAIPTADPEIVSVNFGSWTWGVNGRTYPDVAEVKLRQAATVNGSPVTQVEVQHYWFDGSRWRWFFGADAGFVDTLQAQLPPDATPTDAFPERDYARINMVWSEIFKEAGVPYSSPDGINAIPSLPTTTGCGRMTADDYSEVFYCTLDQEIYYMTDFADVMDRQFGDYAWPHIVSHEWGHHIQFLLGINSSNNPELDDGLYDIELELQADCLAGVYAQEAVARGWLTETDLNDAYQISLFAADSPNTPFDDPLAHGNGDQRQQAFTNGLEDGLFGCHVDIAAET